MTEKTPEQRAAEVLPLLIGWAAASKDDKCVALIATAIREAVEHGDDKHRQWLMDKIAEHFTTPAPASAGWHHGDMRCDACDNGIYEKWPFCPWCGKANDANPFVSIARDQIAPRED